MGVACGIDAASIGFNRHPYPEVSRSGRRAKQRAFAQNLAQRLWLKFATQRFKSRAKWWLAISSCQGVGPMCYGFGCQAHCVPCISDEMTRSV